MKKGLLNKNFIIITLISAFIYISSSMIITTIPKYAAAAGVSDTIIGLLMVSYTLSMAFTRNIWGYFSDRWGRGAVIVTGVIIFILGILMLFFKFNIILLFISRAIIGVGFSAVVTASATAASEAVPYTYLSNAIAIYGLGGVLTQGIAPPLSIWLFEFSFFIVIISAIIVAVISLILCKMVTYRKARDNHSSVKFQNKAIPISAVAGLITFTTAGVLSFLPLMQVDSGIRIEGFFIANSIGLLLGRIIFTRISDSLNLNVIFYFGALVFAISFLALSVSSSNTVFLASGLMYGYGLGTIHPILNIGAIDKVKKENRAGGMAVFYFFQDMGVAIGSALFGIVINVSSFKLGFIGCSFFVFIAIILYKIIDYKENLKKENRKI